MWGSGLYNGTMSLCGVVVFIMVHAYESVCVCVCVCVCMHNLRVALRNVNHHFIEPLIPLCTALGIYVSKARVCIC